jgi:RNA recognition motif-containing protein
VAAAVAAAAAAAAGSLDQQQQGPGASADSEAAGIYLRGIPNSTTRDDLIAVFEQYGTITHVLVIPSRTHDTNTAYVDFDTEAAAQKVRLL